MLFIVLFTGLLACAHSSGAGPADPGPHEPPRDRQAHGHHHRFEDAASWARVFDDPARDAWQRPEQVVSAMAIAPGMTVADVGAGTGYFEPYLSRAVGPSGKVLAIDIEPDMVRWIEARAKREGLSNVVAQLGIAGGPSLPDASVDRVLVVDTWHHIQDREGYARGLANALKPGGVVFVVDFTKESPHGPPVSARIPPEAVAAEFASAGLAGQQIDLALPHQYVIRAARPSTL